MSSSCYRRSITGEPWPGDPHMSLASRKAGCRGGCLCHLRTQEVGPRGSAVQGHPQLLSKLASLGYMRPCVQNQTSSPMVWKKKLRHIYVHGFRGRSPCLPQAGVGDQRVIGSGSHSPTFSSCPVLEWGPTDPLAWSLPPQILFSFLMGPSCETDHSEAQRCRQLLRVYSTEAGKAESSLKLGGWEA